MKRDIELVRDLLRLTEDRGHDVNNWIKDIVLEKQYTEEQISHHVWLLGDGGFIELIDGSTCDGQWYRPRCLTWKGHEFLSDIRDKDVWERTIDLAKRGKAESLDAIWQIAKRVVQKKIDSVLGVAR